MAAANIEEDYLSGEASRQDAVFAIERELASLGKAVLPVTEQMVVLDRLPGWFESISKRLEGRQPDDMIEEIKKLPIDQSIRIRFAIDMLAEWDKVQHSIAHRWKDDRDLIPLFEELMNPALNETSVNDEYYYYAACKFLDTNLNRAATIANKISETSPLYAKIYLELYQRDVEVGDDFAAMNIARGRFNDALIPFAYAYTAETIFKQHRPITLQDRKEYFRGGQPQGDYVHAARGLVRAVIDTKRFDQCSIVMQMLEVYELSYRIDLSDIKYFFVQALAENKEYEKAVLIAKSISSLKDKKHAFLTIAAYRPYGLKDLEIENPFVCNALLAAEQGNGSVFLGNAMNIHINTEDSYAAASILYYCMLNDEIAMFKYLYANYSSQSSKLSSLVVSFVLQTSYISSEFRDVICKLPMDRTQHARLVTTLAQKDAISYEDATLLLKARFSEPLNAEGSYYRLIEDFIGLALKKNLFDINYVELTKCIKSTSLRALMLIRIRNVILGINNRIFYLDLRF